MPAKPTPPFGAPAHPPPGHVEIVDPRWLLHALGITFAVALLCAYLTACFLFYQGAWQLVLHPSRTVDRTPSSIGMPFTPVRFSDFSTGSPHLTGWWIPAPSSSQQLAPTSASPSRYSDVTILYLHGGSGSLSDTLPTLGLLHHAGLNIFAIDYRGFGASDSSAHPDANLMAQDTAAALDYLIDTQHIPATSIVPMGLGLGASLAVQLAHDHPQLPAIILDNPNPDPAATAAAASPSRIIPIRLLFGNRFAIAGPLATLTTPKLLIAGGPPVAGTRADPLDNLFHRAAAPNTVVTLPPANSEAALESTLRHFLDQYATHQ